MIHNPLPAAAGIVGLLSGRSDIAAIDYTHRLILAPWPHEEVRKAADAQLTAVGQADAVTEAALVRILDAAARHGASLDGALMMHIGKQD